MENTKKILVNVKKNKDGTYSLCIEYPDGATLKALVGRQEEVENIIRTIALLNDILENMKNTEVVKDVVDKILNDIIFKKEPPPKKELLRDIVKLLERAKDIEYTIHLGEIIYDLAKSGKKHLAIEILKAGKELKGKNREIFVLSTVSYYLRDGRLDKRAIEAIYEIAKNLQSSPFLDYIGKIMENLIYYSVKMSSKDKNIARDQFNKLLSVLTNIPLEFFEDIEYISAILDIMTTIGIREITPWIIAIEDTIENNGKANFENVMRKLVERYPDVDWKKWMKEVKSIVELNNKELLRRIVYKLENKWPNINWWKYINDINLAIDAVRKNDNKSLKMMLDRIVHEYKNLENFVEEFRNIVKEVCRDFLEEQRRNLHYIRDIPIVLLQKITPYLSSFSPDVLGGAYIMLLHFSSYNPFLVNDKTIKEFFSFLNKSIEEYGSHAAKFMEKIFEKMKDQNSKLLRFHKLVETLTLSKTLEVLLASSKPKDRELLYLDNLYKELSEILDMSEYLNKAAGKSIYTIFNELFNYSPDEVRGILNSFRKILLSSKKFNLMEKDILNIFEWYKNLIKIIRNIKEKDERFLVTLFERLSDTRKHLKNDETYDVLKEEFRIAIENSGFSYVFLRIITNYVLSSLSNARDKKDLFNLMNKTLSRIYEIIYEE